MDTKSKILFVVLAVFVTWSVYATYQRTMVTRDFYTEQSEEVVDDIDTTETADTLTDTTESTATTTEEVEGTATSTTPAQ